MYYYVIHWESKNYRVFCSWDQVTQFFESQGLRPGHYDGYMVIKGRDVGISIWDKQSNL